MSDVNIPFKQFISSGSNVFNISIPQNWIKDRLFYFEKLYLVPDYYSQKAAELKLDPSVELSETVRANVGFHVKYLSQIRAKDILDERVISATTGSFIKTFNNAFESKKPTFFKYTPCFLDFSLVDYDADISAITEIKNTAEKYYGQAWNDSLHLNFLPTSVTNADNKILKKANNVMYPTNLDEETTEEIRVRLFIGPKTRLTFSNNLILKQLGFIEAQIGQRIKNQFVIANSTDEFQILEAVSRPATDVSAPSGLRITFGPIDNVTITKEYIFNIKREEYLKNDSLLAKFNLFLDELSKITNVKTSLGFTKATNTFNVKCDTGQDWYVALRLPPSLAKRFGFPHQPFIDSQIQSDPVPDMHDLKDINVKSKALILDTGILIICLNNLSATNLIGVYDKIVGSLSPDTAGIMNIQHACYEPIFFPITTYITGPNNTINAQFNLYRLYEDNVLKPFQWTIGSHIYGVLKGRFGQ